MTLKSVSKDVAGNLDKQMLGVHDCAFSGKINRMLTFHLQKASENLEWLFDNMHPYFFITMREEAEAKGIGAISFEGKMIDRMSYLQAKDLLGKKESISVREDNQKRVSEVNVLEIFR